MYIITLSMEIGKSWFRPHVIDGRYLVTVETCSIASTSDSAFWVAPLEVLPQPSELIGGRPSSALAGLADQAQLSTAVRRVKVRLSRCITVVPRRVRTIAV